MISLNTNTLGLLSILQALHSLLGAISVTTFLIKKKLNAFDQFLKRKRCEKSCSITTSFTVHIWPPSALQAMDHWYSTY